MKDVRLEREFEDLSKVYFFYFVLHGEIAPHHHHDHVHILSLVIIMVHRLRRPRTRRRQGAGLRRAGAGLRQAGGRRGGGLPLTLAASLLPGAVGQLVKFITKTVRKRKRGRRGRRRRRRR